MLFIEVVWDLLSGSVAQRWSLTLLHFVWQGFVVAAGVSLILPRLRPADSAKRYSVALLGLGLFILLPCVTYWSVDVPALTPDGPSIVSTSLGSATESAIWTDMGTVAEEQTTATDAVDTSSRFRLPSLSLSTNRTLATFRALLVCVWVLMQLLLGGRLAVGALIMWRIRRTSECVAEQWQQVAKKLSRQIGLRRVPTLLSSCQIGDAATYGFFRHIVIVPAGWLTSMPAEMIEAVLAHEFAHIHRHDVWVNFLQRIVETVFFFHPAVWWLSKQIRSEREHRCDTAAVALTGDPIVFARTLEAAARMRVGLAFAAESSFQSNFSSNQGDDRMSLLHRVHRVLNHRNGSLHGQYGLWQLGMLALMVPLLLTLGITSSESLGVEPPPSPIPYGVYQTSERTDGMEVTPVSAALEQATPHEGNRITLPDYVVEPPDVLMLVPQRLAPNGKYRLAASDRLRVQYGLGTAASPARDSDLTIDADGMITIRSTSHYVAGLNAESAKQAIEQASDLKIDSLTIVRSGADSVVDGKKLIGPDGNISLGRLGQMYVAGKTIAETKDAIEKHLSKYFEQPAIAVTVGNYNSKAYYVIRQSSDQDETRGDMVYRNIVTGNETVLDAIALAGDLEGDAGALQVDAGYHLWISRPTGSSTNKILPVDWEAITSGKSTKSNYQLLPGDRLFISDQPLIDKLLDKVGRHTPRWQATVTNFNRLVEQKQFREAIQCARSIPLTKENSAVVQALHHHVKLMEKDLATERTAEEKRVADASGTLGNSRVTAIELDIALQKKCRFDFDETPLKDALASIADEIDINIRLGNIACEGVVADTRVSLRLKRPISAKSALHLILAPFRLTTRYQDEGLIVLGETQAVHEMVAKLFKHLRSVARPMREKN